MVEKSQTVIICDDECPMIGDGLLLADGFEDAFIGVAMRFGWNEPVALYDYEKCIRTLVARDGMDREGAEEYFSYNVIGAWVGDQTPVFVVGTTLEAVHKATDLVEAVDPNEYN
jgi:hypothetical protein